MAALAALAAFGRSGHLKATALRMMANRATLHKPVVPWRTVPYGAMLRRSRHHTAAAGPAAGLWISLTHSGSLSLATHAAPAAGG